MSTTQIPEWRRKLMEIWDRRDAAGFYELDELFTETMNNKNRIIAVMGGGEWNDASVDHIIVAEGVDLDKEKNRRDEWYQKEYVPKLRAGERPDYYTFPEWLIKEGLARKCTDDEVIEYWDD